MSRQRNLFGGALQATLPENVIDASDLRQVPDTQEVFLLPDSDVSIIFEILEMVTEGQAGLDLREAVKFHFSAIAHDNSAFSSEADTFSLPFPLPTCAAISANRQASNATKGASDQVHLYATLTGTQSIAKYNLPANQADLVRIHLAVIRVDMHESSPADRTKARGADITVVVNVPLGKSAEIAKNNGKVGYSAQQLQVQAKKWFENIVATFKVVDYGLFG